MSDTRMVIQGFNRNVGKQAASETATGIKEEDNKLSYELDWEFVEGMAKRMAKNKGKYPPYNWQKEMDINKLADAMSRHFIEIQKNNFHDDEDYGHFYAMACNAMMIVYQLKNREEEEDGKRR